MSTTATPDEPLLDLNQSRDQPTRKTTAESARGSASVGETNCEKWTGGCSLSPEQRTTHRKDYDKSDA